MSPTEQYQKRIQIDIENFQKLLASLVKTKINKFSIQSRTKGEDRIAQKLGYYSSNSVFVLRDIYAFRIFVQSVQEGYAAYDLLLKNFPCEHEQTKDYLLHYKKKPYLDGIGFQALQFTLWYRNCRFEVQVTTTQMHEVNETLHEQYIRNKYKK